MKKNYILFEPSSFTEFIFNCLNGVSKIIFKQKKLDRIVKKMLLKLKTYINSKSYCSFIS